MAGWTYHCLFPVKICAGTKCVIQIQQWKYVYTCNMLSLDIFLLGSLKLVPIMSNQLCKSVLGEYFIIICLRFWSAKDDNLSIDSWTELLFVCLGIPVQFLYLHAFFFRPGPPNFFLSRHSVHSPQSALKHPLHWPQRLHKCRYANPHALRVRLTYSLMISRSHSLQL